MEINFSTIVSQLQCLLRGITTKCYQDSGAVIPLHCSKAMPMLSQSMDLLVETLGSVICLQFALS